MSACYLKWAIKSSHNLEVRLKAFIQVLLSGFINWLYIIKFTYVFLTYCLNSGQNSGIWKISSHRMSQWPQTCELGYMTKGNWSCSKIKVANQLLKLRRFSCIIWVALMSSQRLLKVEVFLEEESQRQRCDNRCTVRSYVAGFEVPGKSTNQRTQVALEAGKSRKWIFP